MWHAFYSKFSFDQLVQGMYKNGSYNSNNIGLMLSEISFGESLLVLKYNKGQNLETEEYLVYFVLLRKLCFTSCFKTQNKAN